MTKNTKIMIIVAVVAGASLLGLILILILAALVIPATQQVIKHGNETSAAASLRMLNSAEVNYNFTYPERGYACSLSVLSGNPASGPPSADAAQLISADLASGTKLGYKFSIHCGNTTTEKQEQVTGYQITAVPITVGHTGDRGFCTDESGVIKSDPKGGTNCTELVQ